MPARRAPRTRTRTGGQYHHPYHHHHRPTTKGGGGLPSSPSSSRPSSCVCTFYSKTQRDVLKATEQKRERKFNLCGIFYSPFFSSFFNAFVSEKSSSSWSRASPRFAWSTVETAARCTRPILGAPRDGCVLVVGVVSFVALSPFVFVASSSSSSL